MSESVGQKDQTLRKCEQEIEALTFRNQQLTSRVEVLQRELQTALSVTATQTPTAAASVASGSLSVAASTSSSSSNLIKVSPSTSSLIISPANAVVASTGSAVSPTTPLPSDHSVIAEELEHKINENTVLHR